VKECIKQLKAKKQEMEPIKIDKLLGERSIGVHPLSTEGEKNYRIKRTPFTLEVFFS